MAFVLIVLALLGMPLFAVVALAALGGYWRAGLDPLLASMEFVRIGELPLLVVLPLFTFAGVLLAQSRAPQRLVELMQSVPGRMPGALVFFALIPCSLMTAFTGASGIAVVALGSLLLPALIRAGLSHRSSLGVATLAAAPGVLLAPSIPLIIYAVVAQRVVPRAAPGIQELFLAGLLPALLMLALMGGYVAWAHRPLPRDKGPRKPLGPALRNNLLELPLPVVVLAGIYSGWLTVVEAALVAVAWVLITLVLIRREVRLSKLPEVVTEAMVLVAAVLLLLGASMASANVMIDAGVLRELLLWLEPLVANGLIFLLAVSMLLLVAGMLLDTGAAVVVLAPLVIPLAMAFEVDPVHLGIVFAASLQIGHCAPPLGVNLLLASRSYECDILAVRRAALPFMGVLLAALLVVSVWPALSLGLPSLLGE